MSKIEEYRIRKNLTQRELAHRIGCTQIDISRYESGTHKPNVERLQKMAKILGVSMEDLL